MTPELVTMIKNKEMTAGELYLNDGALLFVGNNPDCVIPGKAAVYSNLMELSFDKIIVANEYQGLLGIINEEKEAILFSMKNPETVSLWKNEILARLDSNKAIQYLKIGYLNMRTEENMRLLLTVLKRCRLFVLCSEKEQARPLLNLASDNRLYAFAYTEKETIPERFRKNLRISEMSGEDLIAYLKSLKQQKGSPFSIWKMQKKQEYNIGGFFLDPDTETSICVDYEYFK